jgi:hypothetical protein
MDQNYIDIGILMEYQWINGICVQLHASVRITCSGLMAESYGPKN